MYFEVGIAGHTPSVYKHFRNAYTSYVEQASENPVVREILESGYERAERELKETGYVSLDFGDDLRLETYHFEDEEEN